MQKLTKENEHLIFENEKLTHYVLNTFFKISKRHKDYEDYVQEAYKGLIKAAITYGYNPNTSFSTYAIIVIRNEISIYRRDKINPIKYSRKMQLLLPTFIECLNNGLTDNEIVTKLNINSYEDLGELYSMIGSMVRLDEPAVNDDDDITYMDLIPDKNIIEIDDYVLIEKIQNIIKRELRNKSILTKNIYNSYIDHILNNDIVYLTTIASEFNVTRQYVSLIICRLNASLQPKIKKIL